MRADPEDIPDKSVRALLIVLNKALDALEAKGVVVTWDAKSLDVDYEVPDYVPESWQ